VLIALSFQTLPASTVPLGIRYLPIALASLAIFIGLPPLYLEARRIHDDRELVDLIDQSRLGEARHLAHQSLILDPQRSIRGQPLREVAIGLDRAVEDLERNVSNPLPASASDEIRLSRARDLAMLGRTREALGELSQSDSLDRSPDAAILRGAILQTREEYASSLAAFERAADLLKPAVPSPDRTAALVAAHSGIAFAHRKLGHNAAAEAAYQRVLALNSSADTHYLLAQFYEGTQQAAKAQFHARQAMALDPDRYSQPGQRLIDKLITHHFGCWGAAAAERNSR
jgi:tetratricopeptide (TPR) repeat protein